MSPDMENLEAFLEYVYEESLLANWTFKNGWELWEIATPVRLQWRWKPGKEETQPPHWEGCIPLDEPEEHIEEYGDWTIITGDEQEMCVFHDYTQCQSMVAACNVAVPLMQWCWFLGEELKETLTKSKVREALIEAIDEVLE